MKTINAQSGEVRSGGKVIKAATRNNDGSEKKSSSNKSIGADKKDSSGSYSSPSYTGNGRVKISQADYDAQKSLLDSPGFSGSFGARDYRNGNVDIGDYTPTSAQNPITGKTESLSSHRGGGIYGNKMAQQGMDVANSLGYGDISGTFKNIDVPTWQNAMRIGADNDSALQLASGELKSLGPDFKLTPTMLSIDTSTKGNGSYDPNFYKGGFTDAARALGYGDQDITAATKGKQLLNPFGLTGHAAEFAYSRDQGLDEAQATEMAMAGTQGDFGGLPSWYDQSSGEAAVSAKDLIPRQAQGLSIWEDTETNTKLASAGIDTTGLTAEEKRYAMEYLKEVGY